MMLSSSPLLYRSSHGESTETNPIDGYQRTLILHVIEHWKWKTNEHHQLTSNMEAIVPYKTEISMKKPDKRNANDDLLVEADKCQKTSKMMTMKKRETPVSLSATRRRRNMINHLTPVKRATDGNLLSIEQKKRSNRKGNSCTSTTFSSGPIFIAPKKSTNHLPSLSSGHVYDYSLQSQRKPVLQRQRSLNDFRLPSAESSSTLPSVSSHAESFQSISKQRNPHENLFVRERRTVPMKPTSPSNVSLPNAFMIPSTILITDPSGYSHVYDPDDVLQSKDVERNDHDDSTVPLDNNTLGPHSVFNTDSTSPELIIIPPTPPSNHDKHKLDSIGEEEEENEDDEEMSTLNSEIFSKELQRIEAATTKPYHHLSSSHGHSKSLNQMPVQIQDDINVSRRWSDSICSQEQTINSSSASTSECPKESETKSNFLPSMKVSIGKYLMMKLHLAPSNKTDTTTMITPQKGTVRRSPNKKRYQTQ